MIELPNEMRESLIEQLEGFLTGKTELEPDAVAEFAITALESAAEEHQVEGGDDIVARLEASGELESSLEEVLQEALEDHEDFDYTAEEIVGLLEKLCEVEWSVEEEEEEEDEIGGGFFDDEAGMFEDED